MAGVSTLGQSLRQIESLNLQNTLFSELSMQLASGKKTQSYAGLNTDALISVRSRTELSSISVYINNITRSDTTLALSTSAMAEFQEQSRNFSGTLLGLVQQGSHQMGDDVLYDDPATTEIEEIVMGNTSSKVDADLQAVADHAGNLFNLLGELINSKEGDRYLFAGADISQRPFTDTGTLDATLNTLITSWKNGTITTDELIADIKDGTALNGNPDAITDTAIGFSSSLSNGGAGDVFVRASESSEFKYTTLANDDSLRNMMVALAVMKNENLLPVVDVYESGTYPATPDVKGAPGATAKEQKDNFYQLYNAMSQMVSQSIDGVDQIRFKLENVRVQASDTKKALTDQQMLLQNTVSRVEDIDVNEVAVKLTTLQTQLEASYRVTAITQNLSLVKFL